MKNKSKQNNKNKKKIKAITCALVFSLFMSQATYVKAADINTQVNTVSEKIVSDQLRLQDDFYNVVNKNWLNTTKIEAGNMYNSSFNEAAKTSMEQKKNIIKDLLKNEKSYAKDSYEKKIINLYNNILNTQARNKEKIEPIKEILNKIKDVKSLDDITNLDQNIISNPLINFSVDIDSKDANKHVLSIGTSKLSLGNSDEYLKPTENSARIKALTETYFNKILTLAGNTPEEAKKKVDNLFKLENMIAPLIIGQEEASKNPNIIEQSYNVYKLDKLTDLAPNLNLKTIMRNLKVDKANKIILSEPKWLKGLNEIYKEENLQLIKDYIEIKNLSGNIGVLSEDFENAFNEYNNATLGVTGEIPKDEKAISSIDKTLPMIFGKMYVEKYFSEETKNNVKKMTAEIIDTYKTRIEKLDWMSEATKEKAIEKLGKITFQIGYPDKWDDYSKIDIRSYEEGGSLFENIKNIVEFQNEKQLKKLNESVDKSEFGCPPQEVNAFYNPASNTITVPAGILQKPFYDVNATKEYNLGGIGVVIGHEISHAFDTTGSKFDGDGNLKNWWSEEDYKKFEEKATKVRNFYSNVKLDNGKNVNGNLTVGENIADLGGVACGLDILSKMTNANYKDFFESNATIWREISTKEFLDYIVKYDPHSPSKVRINSTLPQFDKFYDVYGIKENDKMYVNPQDRLEIW